MIRRLAFVALCAIASVVFMGKSYETSLQALDSTTHAMIALEVAGKGPLPNLPMANFPTVHPTDLQFNDHPFPLFYLAGKFMHWFGPEAWTARFVPTLFSVGCVMLTAWLGTLMYSASTGLIAGLILLMSRDFVMIGSRFHLDTAMVFFILLSFILWWKKRPLWTGVAAGLGLWMKAPVAFLIFPSALFALALSNSLNRKEFINLILGGLVGLATGATVWILTGALGGFDLVRDYWTRQVWGTAVGGRGNTGPVNHLWGIQLLIRSYLPWIVFLVWSIIWIILKKQWKRIEVALPLAAALTFEGVLALIRFKHYWYFVPVFPFLALLCAMPFANWLKNQSIRIEKAIIILAMLLPTLLVILPIKLGPENFPGLRKFSPIIQAYGDCNHQVLFINGEQPFGSDLDNTYELGFYTGRKILKAECSEAEARIAAENPEWIIATGKNRSLCLSATTLKRYPAEYRFGSQSLFSRIIPPGSVGDLTPLARELKPPRGCVSVPIEQNLYFPK
jgi:hypothetical protein